MNKIYIKLSEITDIKISSVDKKIKDNESKVKLCNFTDVYYNWDISSFDICHFMIASASKEEINKFSLSKNDILITKDSETRNDIGISCLVKENLPNTILGYHCALIRPNKNIDGAYLNACLKNKTCRKYFSNQASGSGQRFTLSIDGIGSVKIPLIPFDEQKKISRFISNINDKISINNRINDNLQQVLMTKYYHDFENNLDSNTLKKVKIGELVKIISGYPFEPEQYDKDGFYKLITIKNVQDNGLNIDIGDRISKIPNNLPEYCKLAPNDILLSLTGNVGRVATIYSDNCLLNQRVAIVIPSNEQLRTFVYCLFKSNWLRKTMEKSASGTSQKNLSPIEISDILIMFDEKKALNFSIEMQSLFKKMILLQNENMSLRKLRNDLLPLLINGQVTIR
ncbi:MAG: restriction endonuclease subunit S [Bacilli bacterium]